MLFMMMTVPEAREDRAFLEELYREYHRLMYWIAKKYIDNDQDCADVVHDSLVRLIRNTDTLRGLDRTKLPSYVAATVRHTACNHLRHEQLRRGMQAPLYGEQELPDRDTEDLLLRVEDRDLLRALGQRLTREERLLLEGKFLLQLPNDQLAALLQCRPDSLRTKLQRIRQHLQAYLKEMEGGESDDSKKSSQH